jgi:hypothetical protein
MRFDIDYSHAKTMATRLQNFLDGSPKKLSRSSAIEAIAQMLGFNNRNEMAARIDVSEPDLDAIQTIQNYEQLINEIEFWPIGIHDSICRRFEEITEENQKSPTHTPYPDPTKPREVAMDALNDLRQIEIQDTARALVDHGRKIAPDADFREAMHAENDNTGTHVLMDVEDRVIQNLLLDPQRRRLLAGVFAEDPEMEGARTEGLDDLPSQLARTLVNSAMPIAEDLWDDDTYVKQPMIHPVVQEFIDQKPPVKIADSAGVSVPSQATLDQVDEIIRNTKETGPLPLEEIRHTAAENEFDAYDFKGWKADENGWAIIAGQDEWTRTVFFYDRDNLHGDTVRGHFTIVFEPGTANVLEAYASVRGNDVGRRGQRSS